MQCKVRAYYFGPWKSKPNQCYFFCYNNTHRQTDRGRRWLPSAIIWSKRVMPRLSCAHLDRCTQCDDDTYQPGRINGLFYFDIFSALPKIEFSRTKLYRFISRIFITPILTHAFKANAFIYFMDCATKTRD